MADAGVLHFDEDLVRAEVVDDDGRHLEVAAGGVDHQGLRFEGELHCCGLVCRW